MEKIKSFIPKRLTNFQVFIFHFIVALVIFHPYLVNEFWADEYFFVSVLKSKEIKYPIAGFWSIDINDYDSFQNIWWKDENVKGRFFRPIPSLFFSTIYWITPSYSALILHFCSILLHSLVAFTVFLVLFKFSKIYSASFLASFIFLIAEDHSMTVGWISTNSDLFAVLFINLGLYYHVKFRETGKNLHKRLTKLYMFLALLSKETAVIGPFAIILYEFILLESQSGEKNIFKRLLNKLILLIRNEKYWRFHFLLLFVFLSAYKILGFGMNNLMYIDPFKRPMDYLTNIITGLPTMLTGLLTNIPFGIVLFDDRYLYSMMGLGIFLYLLLSINLAPYWKTRMVHYSFILFTISLLPQLITMPSERLIYFPFVFGSFLIAYLILNVFPLKQIFMPQNPKGLKYVGNIFGYYLILACIICAFYLSLVYPNEFKNEFRKINFTVAETKKFINNETKDIYYLTTPSIFYTFYLNDVTKQLINENLNVYPLSSFNGDLRIKKLDENAFLLETDSLGWLNNLFAKGVRVYPKFEVGKKYYTKKFSATILKTTLDGKDVQSVKFEFNSPLNNSNNLFVFHDGKMMRKLNADTLLYNNWYLLRHKLPTLY
ncbi:MAG: hypothetical protein N3F03_06640 [Ignavibacteria bacterium]|nr:hypothetical protein [Ignavibacteria bacterium]